MAAFRHRASGPVPVTRSSDEFAPAFAVTEAGLAVGAIAVACGLDRCAGGETATENDVNPLIASQRLNRMETRLFHDLFDAIRGRDAMIDFDGSMEALPVERPMLQSQSGGPHRGLAGRAAGRRAA